jgi:branched-chain amino acid transport system ATP-binding protein
MLLEVKDLEAGYGEKQVLYGISLTIADREIVSLIGHNGAGKSTALKSIVGLVPPGRGKILFADEDLTPAPPSLRLARGIYHLPQEYFLFNDLSVRENLEVSSFTMGEPSLFESRLGKVFEIFPVLEERKRQLAGTLSGGERRMLGIGMGLLRQPRLLMLDEPSSGLSPVVFQKVAGIIRDINREMGTAVLLVEQNVKVAFKLSKRVFVMKAGRMILEESGEKLLQRGQWWELF